MKKSNLKLATVLLAGFAIVAAACGDDKGSSSTTAAAGSVTCKNLTIAMQGPLTGPAAGLGKPVTQGIQLAINQFNAKNAGCQIKYQPEDSQGDPALAPAIAKKLVAQKDVVGLVGPEFSGESDASGPTYSEAGLVTVSPSATRVDLTSKGYKSFHRVLGSDAVQGPGIARYIQNTLKPKTVAVIDDASAYGKGLADLVKVALETTVTVTDAIDPKAQDYSAAVTKVKNGNVDMVFFGGYYEAAGRLAKQLRDAGVKATFIFGDGVKDPGFITAAGPAAAEGAYITCTCTDPASLPGGAAFVTAYKTKFGEDPGTYAAEAFDSANLLLAGIAAGKQDRASLLDFVNTVDFPGITHAIKFTPLGEVDAKKTYAFQVKGGLIVYLGEILP